ncbi:MAG: chemotaxis protein CheW [Rhodocyclaceae bacterium]|nr:MAG: chemotaxis protein CheW [Rhodocyclaceae bacterium]
MGFAVVFVLDEQRFAVPLPMVEQVVRAVAVSPLPKAPAVVRGMIDVHGEIVPVMDIRLRLGLPSRAMALSDQIIIARTSSRHIAFAVENIAGVAEWDDVDFVAAQAVVPGVEFLDGVVRNREGLILVYDPDAFFLAEEHPQLDHALDQAVGQARVHG